MTRNSKIDPQTSQDLSTISLTNKVEDTKENQEQKLNDEDDPGRKSSSVDHGKIPKKKKNLKEGTNPEESEDINLKGSEGTKDKKDGRKEYRFDIPDQPIICYENRLVNQGYDQFSKVQIKCFI